MPEQLSTKHWRRRLRISVRALMAFVLISGGAVGWVVHRARVQRDAVTAIKRAGAIVMYDWQFKKGIPNLKGEPWAPKWVGDLLGVDYLGSAVYVIAATPNINDSILVPIGHLSRLERLDLSLSAVTDAGLIHLDGLNRLQTLELEATDVGDAGLAHLKGLNSLEGLYLNATKVGDAGMMHLEDLTNLQHLSLGGTQVSDAGLAHLKGLASLRGLNLVNTHVGDAGLVRLKDLTGLRFLCIGGTQVSDAGLSYLKDMRALKRLVLSDADTSHPEKVSDTGIQELQRALPNLKID